MAPPSREKKRDPPAKLNMDMAGMGEKPKILSGPYFFIVYIIAEAMISKTSSQLDLLKPPLPLAHW